MDKILIIGQAPPAVTQGVPYDTTMLYSWLEEIDISKEQAQELFTFDAVYDKFPGHGQTGHLKPTQEQMEEYYHRSLQHTLINHRKVVVLGAVAKEFLRLKMIAATHQVLMFMHPSTRNYAQFQKQKVHILRSLKEFIS